MAAEKTMICERAAKMVPGTEPTHLQRMCLKGKRLLKLYGSKEKIPAKEFGKALFGKKVGKYWYIPESEINRVFFP